MTLRYSRFSQSSCSLADAAQMNIPESVVDGKPLGLSLFIDIGQLSSFGTQKAHPVIARITNLESPIRNGNGLGGGRIVGFLPIVSSN